MENKTLSSKDILVDNKTGIHWRKEEDVKEFIQTIKDDNYIKNNIDHYPSFIQRINELAGENFK